MSKLSIHRSSRALAAMLLAGLASSSSVLADFKGGDTLKTVISSNWFYSANGGGAFQNANSRLEFQVKTPVSDNSAFLTWRPNDGTASQNWCVQVDAYLDLFSFPVQGDGIELALGILPSGEIDGRFMTVGLNRNRNISSDAGITVLDTAGVGWEVQTKAKAAKLRLHYDKKSKTITPSWDTGSGWKYGDPRDLSEWKMKPGDTFRAVLIGRNGVALKANGAVASGQAYFKNFKAGNASPEIVVEKSAVELQDNKGTVTFSAAKVGVGKVTKTFKIRNDGTSTLNGLNLSVIGGQKGDFSVSNIDQKSLAPGESTTFKVAFQPKDAGLRNSTVYLTSNDADESSFEIKVSGRGVK